MLDVGHMSYLLSDWFTTFQGRIRGHLSGGSAAAYLVDSENKAKLSQISIEIANLDFVWQHHLLS